LIGLLETDFDRQRVIMEGIARVDFPPSVVTAQEQRIGVAKIAMALKKTVSFMWSHLLKIGSSFSFCQSLDKRDP
jgi:hypothetical protein